MLAPTTANIRKGTALVPTVRDLISCVSEFTRAEPPGSTNNSTPIRILSILKELHYFDQLSRVQRSSSSRRRDERDIRFLESINSLSAKPHIDLEHYARLFEAKGPLLSGDISPNYSTLSKEVIRQIAGYFPNLKVIFLARDPVERLWSHLSMEVRYHQIEAFDVTDIDEVNRNVLRRCSCARTPAQSSRDGNVTFIQTGFAFISLMTCKEIRLNCGVPVLDFLGADPDKAASRVTADYNSWAGMEKLLLTDKVRSHLAQFFKKELKTCAARLGGPARDWPARYGF